MMSQTSANVDANPPAYMEVRIDKDCGDIELLDGWENWSLEDIIRVVELMKEGKRNGRHYSLVATNLGQITLNKLLKAADDPNVPFERIEETVNLVLHENLTILDTNILEFTGFLKGWQPVCEFFKAFIKHGEHDARYYDLIYMILTHQPRKNDSFPIGHSVRNCEGFRDAVLVKFPPEMRERLESESFYAKDGNVCYSLLTDAAVNM